jgi:hypothetical protein
MGMGESTIEKWVRELRAARNSISPQATRSHPLNREFTPLRNDSIELMKKKFEQNLLMLDEPNNSH